jgi:RHS repeat-associated protein
MLLCLGLATRADTPSPNPNNQNDFLESCSGGDGSAGDGNPGAATVMGGSSNDGCCGGQGSAGGFGNQGWIPAVTYGSPSGLPVWSVSQPYLNLWVRDVPLGYRPAKGPAVAFQLSYKQREDVAGVATNVFSVGTRWNCSWLSYVSNSAPYGVLLPGGGLLNFDYDTAEYFTGGRLSINAGAYQIAFPDGSTNVYGMINSGCDRYYLTEKIDAAGNKLTFEYDNQGAYPEVIRLLRVIDADGATNTVHYTTNAWSSVLIQYITDRFGHTNFLSYDPTGQLTNLTDVVGLSASVGYDANGWITSLTTPYGTTSFQHTNDDVTAFRSITASDPVGGKHLWVYRGLAISVSTNIPNFDTAPYSLNWAGRDLSVQNSFHWGPRQYEQLTHTNDLQNLTTDEYRLGHRQHWLDAGGTHTGLSMQQDFSPDGTTNGQQTWLDYEMNGSVPAQRRPLMALRDMPVGPTNATWFIRTECNTWGLPTNIVTTWSLPSGSRGLRTNRFAYSTDGRDLIAQYGPDGLLERGLAYSERQVIRSTNAMGEVTYYSYNSAHQLEGTLRPSGLATTNYYFSSGTYTNWLERTVDYQGTTPLRTNAYTYTNGLVLTHTDERDLRVTNSWDALGRLLRMDYPDGTSIQHTYNKLDRVRTVDRLGFSSGWAFDALRRMTYATNALGRVTTYEYCACGPLSSITDPLGQATLFYYDLAGRRTNTSGADGFEAKVFYNLAGQVARTTDSAGLAVTNYYNHQGLPYTASNAFGRLSLVLYDVHDRATNSVDANGITVTNSFDALGRILVRGYPDGGIERFAYTTNVAAVTRYTNQVGNAILHAYDVYGRKSNEAYVGVSTNLFTYDAGGAMKTLRDGKNQLTTWDYNQYGQLTNKVEDTGQAVFRYTYDAGGRLSTRWTPEKGTTTYRYDPVGNLTNLDYPSSADLTLTYDAVNRLTNLVDAVGTTRYTWNAIGQLLSEDGPWSDDTVSLTYQNRLRAGLSVTQPNAVAWSQSYAFDAMKRLTNLASPAGSFGYDYKVGPSVSPASLVRLITLPGGNWITNELDSVGRVTSTKLLNAQLSTLNQHLYTYDLAGERTKQTRTDGSYVDYGYDGMGQLLTAIGKESGGTKRWHEQFGYKYDPAGNLNWRTNNDLAQQFQVNTLNELTNVSRPGTVMTVAGTTTSAATNVTVNTLTALLYADYTFARTNVSLSDGSNNFTAIALDNLGRTDSNTVSAWLPAAAAMKYDLNGNLTNDSRRVLIYDDENQLTTIIVTNASGTITKSEFVYDGKMRRRLRNEYTLASGTWNPVAEVRYIYDGMLVVQERHFTPQISTNTPQQLVTYTRGRDLSGTLEGAGGIGGLLARTEVPSSILHLPSSPLHALYHADGNGNVTCLIGTNSIVLARYLYDPYGNILSQSGSLADANLYRFSSKEWHVASGLVYYGYRFYAPEWQRLPSRDPIGESGFELLRYRSNKLLGFIGTLRRIGGDNLYAFVRNQPIGVYDQVGLAPGTPTGPDTLACIAAQEQAIAAMDLLECEPCPENVLKLEMAIAAAIAACTPPPPPPTPEWCPPSRWVPPYSPPSGPEVARKCGWAAVGVVLIWVCVVALAPVGL